MYFTSATGLILGLMAVLSTAAPAEEIRDNAAAVVTLPATCNVKSIKACHTYQAYTTPTSCPQIKCTLDSDIVCPLIVKLTTSTVPCATNCCPTTPTKYITAACPTCTTGCVIPTYTETVTTGCKTTAATLTAAPSVTLVPGATSSVTLVPGRV